MKKFREKCGLQEKAAEKFLEKESEKMARTNASRIPRRTVQNRREPREITQEFLRNRFRAQRRRKMLVNRVKKFGRDPLILLLQKAQGTGGKAESDSRLVVLANILSGRLSEFEYYQWAEKLGLNDIADSPYLEYRRGRKK